ncbi:SMI1/KNR4 family protein [Lysinibacillus xylanilyticus]|uniref:SMI1/KNR4 family protein n=1 Tax=Lysinibacillus xylanilyticus TaxID=582475 RepID=UPI003D041CAD
MRKIKFINRYHKRAVLEDDFVKLEKALEKKLPDSYIEFYKLSNGGVPEENTIYDEDEEVFNISFLYPLSAKETESTISENVFFMIKQHVLGNRLYLPFGEDGSGNILYLDFNFNEPTVCACFFDEPDEETGLPYTHIEIAENLFEFLEILEEYRKE